ncbi:GyrI-like domain-containing protein [Paenibacillus sp. BC26]|uniref:GyrI-like domain-containing protein n=1 Tax=Paenibacillus sp. BC26 TaxID=1881032 RepID=UPI0008ED8A73|nr:GyrI-like domain-containing protein [Paenibacillus sp. BC26]SFT19508.1 hypothetical protein SAMN05428962_5049 [Paenibacillus sp. BC26]
MIPRSEVVREDVRRSNKAYYSLRDKAIHYYHIPQMQYLIASGYGNRDIYKMHEYKEVWTIGRFINRVKYHTVRELGKNFSRMPIEMAWGTAREEETDFTAMMWVPDYISYDLFHVTVRELKNKLERFDFELSLTAAPKRYCAQLLHTGSYDQIESSVRALVDGVAEEGYQVKGKIHEIFMNHPHCNPPEKLNILLRQELCVNGE